MRLGINLHLRSRVLLAVFIDRMLDDANTLFFGRQIHVEARAVTVEFSRYIDLVTDQYELAWHVAVLNADVLEQANVDGVANKRMKIEQHVRTRFGYGANVLEHVCRLRVDRLGFERNIDSLQPIGDRPAE